MSITTILLDLDGTLLPMDQNKIAKAYIKELATAAELAGYSPMLLLAAFRVALRAMLNNNGEKTNEDVFWDSLENTYGEYIRKDTHLFDVFYANHFQKIQDICGITPAANKLVHYIREKGYRVVLATNAILPRAATESCIRWAGLNPEDFELYTTYETSRYCKPDLNYYQDILNQLQVTPEECLMVGNDVSKDMVAEQLGMKVFLLTDYLINKNKTDISIYPHGNMSKLFAFINAIE